MNDIALVPNRYKDTELICARNVAKKTTELGKRVFVASEHYPHFSDIDGVVSADEHELFEKAELAVVIGGDGSIIHTARRTALKNIPLLGINLGRLGYLAELEYDELDMLGAVYDGRYTLERRMMLSYEVVKKDGERVTGDPALNDIVLTSLGNTNRVVDIEIFEEGHDAFAGAFRGDGVIASTPTGSTAYALAAGGPIIEPSLDCIGIVPICTHSLMARPMLFSPTSTLRLVNAGRATINASADGSDEYKLEPGEYVRVSKSEYAALFVRVRNSFFYEVLHSKMAEK